MTLQFEPTLTGSTRRFLRAQTDHLHRSLDVAWTDGLRFGSLGHYRKFLQMIDAGHRAFGLPAARVFNCPSSTDLDLERARIAALEEDLGDAVGALAEADIAETNPSFAGGVLYVLNGSALGASTMLKRGYLEPGWPSSYLRLAQEYACSGQLKLFFDRLEAPELDCERARDGAVAVFEFFVAQTACPTEERAKA